MEDEAEAEDEALIDRKLKFAVDHNHPKDPFPVAERTPESTVRSNRFEPSS